MPQFVKDVEEIRRRALNKIEEGAVTNAYRGDKDRTISILNEALATEIVCVLRYMHHYFMATGVHGRSVADEFKEHADAEREHADQIGERIQQLGGKPDYNPGTLVARSASQYREGGSLADMIREDLIAERVVIEVYNEMIRHFGNNDPTTRVMIEGILKDEEEHASELSDLLYVVDPHSGETAGEDPGSDPLKMEKASGNRGRRQRASGRRQPVVREGETREMGLAADGGRGEPQNRQRGNQKDQPRASQGNQQEMSQTGDGSPGISPQPGGRGGQHPQGRGPSFQQQPGRSFAGEDHPNPPGRAGSAAIEGRQQTEQFGGRGSAGREGNRSRRGRRGRRAA